WAEKVPATMAGGRTAVADAARKTRRVDALRRLGGLGLRSVRAPRTLGAIQQALRSSNASARATAARALGQVGGPAARGPLPRRGVDKEPEGVREAGLAGLTDLGLVAEPIRSQILRNLAARLAAKDLSSAVAEQVWRALRGLAALGSAGKK